MALFCIFYDRAQLRHARTMATLVESAGHTPWLADHDSFGDWRSDVEATLAAPNCRGAVIVWSADAIKNPVVIEEAEATIAAGRSLLGLVLDDVVPPIGLRNTARVVIKEWNGSIDHQGLGSVVRKISRMADLKERSLPTDPSLAGSPRGLTDLENTPFSQSEERTVVLARNIEPFYSRVVAWAPGYLVGELGVAAALILLFLAPRTFVVNVFTDWSWLLALLIGSATLCLYYAMFTLRAIIWAMSARLSHGGGNSTDNILRVPIELIFSDRRSLLVGISGGTLYGLCGVLLGSPCQGAGDCSTFYFGLFIAGFVCGLLVRLVYGASVAIIAFGRAAKNRLTPFAPDRTGGVQFIGEALVVFSSVILIVGVLTSLYILNIPWTREGLWWLIALRWFWISAPFAISLIVLTAPAVPLNEALERYKIEEETRFAGRLEAISAELESRALEPEKRRELHEKVVYYRSVRDDVHSMATWPHSVSANLKYLGIFLANMVSIANTVKAVLPKLFP